MPAMSDTPLYCLRGVSKIYHMGEVEVPALVDIDVDVYEREYAVILGASGSGKSTLLHMLGGMDRPTEGSITFREREITALDAAELTRFRRKHVGFIFQLYNLIPSLTALENVCMATEIAPKPRDPQDMLDLVGIGDRANHFPSQLSGGEQQRVAIARGLAKGPEVLLCDEPTGALDYSTGVLVLDVLRHANETLGTTLLVITHNAAIGKTADRVIHMSSGRIAKIEVNDRPLKTAEISW
jgi:putative ABC transport system ATP-binding protein